MEYKVILSRNNSGSTAKLVSHCKICCFVRVMYRNSANANTNDTKIGTRRYDGLIYNNFAGFATNVVICEGD